MNNKVERFITNISNVLPKTFIDTTFMRIFGLTKVPLLWHLRPSVVLMDSDICEIKIPLSRRSKNHLNSMYFAAMCAGADCAAGFMAIKEIQKSKKKVSLSFKDFKADFLKRAEGTTHFKNVQGKEISTFVNEVIKSGQRMEKKIIVYATVPSKMGDEIVAKFELTMSLKYRA